MSTRSRIAMKTESGFRSVYCHDMGYPEGVGRVLLGHYATPGKVAELIALGDLSYLGEEIGGEHTFPPRGDGATMAAYEAEYGRMTRAYGRDRGETEVDPVDDPDFDALAETADGCDAEWLYVWDGRAWSFAGRIRGPVAISDLKPMRHADVNPGRRMTR
jgi:hypothetical protein